MDNDNESHRSGLVKPANQIGAKCTYSTWYPAYKLKSGRSICTAKFDEKIAMMILHRQY